MKEYFFNILITPLKLISFPKKDMKAKKFREVNSMKKITILIALLLVLLTAVPVFAADEGGSSLSDLYDQLLQAKKQVIDSYVENGIITQEQGDAMKERMDLNFQARSVNGFGYGRGFMGGYGRGFGGCGGPASCWGSF